MSDLLPELRAQRWTGHNIPLTPTESTLGPDVPLIGDDARTVVIKSLVRPLRGKRVLDIGSLEGGLSFEMAREGCDVLGIEGREENFAKSELIRRHHALPNLRFELRDAKSLSRERDGTFDVILCCGLLYHLDDPFAFLRQLADILSPDGLLFIDTHVAPDGSLPGYSLSALTTLGDYEGRWFAEPRGGSVLDEMWSAVSNERSFWPTRKSLIRGIYHAGLHQIHELFGAFEIDREFGLREQFSREYLACRKEWS